MAGTVKVDDAAHAASKKFLGIINGELQQSIQQLSAAGNTLSDQSHWDGRHATEFRSAWQGAQTDLNKIKQSLEDFQRRFDSILRSISQAGGNA